MLIFFLPALNKTLQTLQNAEPLCERRCRQRGVNRSPCQFSARPALSSAHPPCPPVSRRVVPMTALRGMRAVPVLPTRRPRRRGRVREPAAHRPRSGVQTSSASPAPPASLATTPPLLGWGWQVLGGRCWEWVEGRRGLGAPGVRFGVALFSGLLSG